MATVLVGLAAWVSSAVRPGRTPARRLPIVAVLPLDAPAAGAAGGAEGRGSAALAEALAEAVAADLARRGAGRFGVVGPGTTRRYDGMATPPERLRNEVGALHVLSGTLRREGDSVRVFVQVVATADRRVVWTQRYAARAADGISPLASRVGEAVAARLAGPTP